MLLLIALAVALLCGWRAPWWLWAVAVVIATVRTWALSYRLTEATEAWRQIHSEKLELEARVAGIPDEIEYGVEEELEALGLDYDEVQAASERRLREKVDRLLAKRPEPGSTAERQSLSPNQGHAYLDHLATREEARKAPREQGRVVPSVKPSGLSNVLGFALVAGGFVVVVVMLATVVADAGAGARMLEWLAGLTRWEYLLLLAVACGASANLVIWLRRGNDR